MKMEIERERGREREHDERKRRNLPVLGPGHDEDGYNECGDIFPEEDGGTATSLTVYKDKIRLD